MSKNRYKRHSRGGRFRNQGDGLRSAVDNIRQQRQIEIDALKLQAQQQKEQSKLQISGLSDVARNKVDNQNIINNLENKIYQNKRNAIDVKGRREVEGILGEAAELGKEAEFWENFATKHAQDYAKLGQGLTEYAQYRAAVNAYEKMTKEEKLLFLEPYEGAYDDVEWNSEKAAWEIPDWKDKKELFKRTHGWFANNKHLHKMLANDYVKTINERVSMIRLNSKTADGEELYNKDSASQLLLNSAYQYLYSSGIPFNSVAGQKILAATNQQIASETNKYSLANEVKEDNKNLEVQTKMLSSYKNDYYDVPVGDGLGTYKSGKDAFEDKFWVLHDTLRGSAKMGEHSSGVLLPSDPIRQSETHKQQITDTIEHIIKHIDFSSESEAISMLNIPVRDMKTGKIIYKKDGKTPAEFLLDKHPDLRQLVAKEVKERNKDIISDNNIKKQSKAIANIEKFNDQIKEDFKNNDFSNTLWNREWKVNYFNTLNKPENSTLPIVQDGFDLIGFEPTAFDQKKGYDSSFYTQYAYIEDEYYAGDINGAMFRYMKLGMNVPELAGVHEAITATLQIPNFHADVKKYVKNEFSKTRINKAGVLNQGISEQNDIDRMNEIGIARFMVIWKNNAAEKNVDTRFDKTKEQFSKEVEIGLKNRQGWAAASEFGATTEGGINLNQGYKFDIIDKTTDKTVTGDRELTSININQMFEGFEEQKNLSPWSGEANIENYQNNVSLNKVDSILRDNFADIVSINDAQVLLASISTGKAANDNLPTNISKFVLKAKTLYSSLTEREIMNKVIGAIVDKGDETWGENVKIDDQLKNYEWPPSTDDLIKKMGGTTTGKYKDNYGLMLNQWLKNQGFNLSDLMVDPETIKNALGVR